MQGCFKKTLILVAGLVFGSCVLLAGITAWGAVDLAADPAATDVPGPYRVGSTMRIADAGDGVDAVPIGDEARVYLWQTPDRAQASCSINAGAEVSLKQHVHLNGVHWYHGVNEALNCGGWIPARLLEDTN